MIHVFDLVCLLILHFPKEYGLIFRGHYKAAKMKRSLGLCLVVCFGILDLGCALRCFKCSDYTGRCENVQDCTYEDSCLSLSERGGKTIRQCIRYTDCDNSRLSQMFPAVSGFTYRCCNSNLCNSSTTIATRGPVFALMGSLLVFWWSSL
ncbi:CD59 glycoprotein [Oncorhynchus masou masou]|uniref:CD59 glycoprotein n=1 Tax=Oncorhynchus masou masou TaxID=90313 RepID=UPI003182E637